MKFGSVKHPVTTRGLIDEPVSSFRSGIDHNDEQMCDFRHFGPLGPNRWEGVKMVRMPHLLAIMVDLSSQTCLVLMSVHVAPYDFTDGDGFWRRCEPASDDLTNKSVPCC